MTVAFVCLTLCLGRKGQNLEPLGPAVPSPHGAAWSSEAQTLAQKESLKSCFVKPFSVLDQLHP